MHSFINVHFKSASLIKELKALNKHSMLHFIFNPNIICVLITYDYTLGDFVLQIPNYSETTVDLENKELYKNIINKIMLETNSLVNDIEIIEIKYWRMRNVYADKWYEDNVFIIGDAAHQFPPSGGYGLNTGVVDSFSLAWRLFYLTNKEKSANFAKIMKDSFQNERLVHTKVILYFISLFQNAQSQILINF
jgi:2-polyprenyl-6-methoxyphenol hydroxylase-like FAD-dependent oxidoreductase